MRKIHSHNEYHKYKSTTNGTGNGSGSGGRNSNEELKGILIGGKQIYDATKDSNGVMVLKCLLVTILCTGGIVVPVIAEMEELGTILCIFTGLGLSVLILKNV